MFQHGDECFCGNGEHLNKGLYNKVSTGCNTHCHRNRHEKCGGNWRLSVYNMQTGTK